MLTAAVVTHLPEYHPEDHYGTAVAHDANGVGG